MNVLVQDVISNKKFLPCTLWPKSVTIEQIEDKIKSEMAKDPNRIQYFFGASPEYPQYFILIYMYKEKKPTKELLKIKNFGITFHEEQFPNLRELIVWFKEHLKESSYIRYARNTAIKKWSIIFINLKLSSWNIVSNLQMIMIR